MRRRVVVGTDPNLEVYEGVLGDRDTVFGGLDAEMESLPPEYRSHGSASEAKEPLYIYNAERAPDPGFFRANVDLTRWAFRS